MRYINFMKFLPFLWCLLVSTTVFSEPTPGIRTLIETPASSFDVFLNQLYIASNGPSYFGGPNMKEQIRIYNLKYDYDSNLIILGFHIGPDNELIKGFRSKGVEGKKEIMLRAAKDIAISLGVEAREGDGRFGLIQSLEIRNGWSTKNFSESEIKDEIANRTVLEVVYAWDKKIMYQVRRTPLGRYEFSMDAKTN